jgi:ABC-2 type transport system ATP-binding protein
MIAVDGVTKRYGPLVAVDDLTFEVGRGEVVGFLGPNGAGKTTTMRMLAGTLQPDQGEVRLDGRPISGDLIGAKRRVGYLPESNALYHEMLVCEYLDFAAELQAIPRAERKRALADAIRETGIGEVYYRPISQLSKGYRQRTGLAAAILHRPEVLILDEPTEGLDPNQRVEIRRLIRELGRDRTVLLSTHVLGEVETTCDRLLIISRGRLVADGGVADLLDARDAGGKYTVEAEGDGVEETLSSLSEVTGHRSEVLGARRVRVQLTVRGSKDLRPRISKLVAERGWTLYELHRERASLEDLFRELTEAPAEVAEGGAVEGRGKAGKPRGKRKAAAAEAGGGRGGTRGRRVVATGETPVAAGGAARAVDGSDEEVGS